MTAVKDMHVFMTNNDFDLFDSMMTCHLGQAGRTVGRLMDGAIVKGTVKQEGLDKTIRNDILLISNTYPNQSLLQMAGHYCFQLRSSGVNMKLFHFAAGL